MQSIPTAVRILCLIALVVGCERTARHEATSTAIRAAVLDAETASIHEAALIGLVTDQRPVRPFTMAVKAGDAFLAYAKESEAKIIAGVGTMKADYLPFTGVRVPNEGEMETMPDGGKRYVGLTSTHTKERIHAYIVTKIDRVSDSSVTVHWMSYCGPLDAHGGTLVLTRTNDRWVVSEIRGGWVS